MDSFSQPLKAILSPSHLAQFQDSETYEKVVKYIERLNDSVIGVKTRDDCSESEGIKAVLSILDQVEEIAKSTPPVNNAASRFGNPAFKDFYDKVSSASSSLHEQLPDIPSEAIDELSVYFRESWGNRSRIDYGSGMELNFLCWILCLEELKVVQESDHTALVIRVFWRYIAVMRILQQSYWLEPAGSHGVWGLDDYHFLPFLWGSAQLRNHRYIKPKSIHDTDIVEEFSRDYMYLACIKFINSIKSATLRWHSPMLDDISAVKTWEKVNTGMIKMYKAEVLNKLPVMQHFLFGSILSFQPLDPEDKEDETLDDPHTGHAHPHVHNHTNGDRVLPNGKVIHLNPSTQYNNDGPGAGQLESGWGDCCGIPVPSALAAAEAEKQKNPNTLRGIPMREGIRLVPFD
ncbi:Phosphotyrosyl phosphatase activator [Cantharellus anzutake]|uniref:Phosphotyrosyl phosphatase activator n=1 Tax=Cantharellus anzutake TaxID=1750568 RepID=UPI001904E2C4|nr:Phosphotyrosyl phosphatase activator [Cantharellus anzutake]KAF8313907.1 Phosphotyrosyl phosphatase activator [Cantharellus anzutake]